LLLSRYQRFCQYSGQRHKFYIFGLYRLFSSLGMNGHANDRLLRSTNNGLGRRRDSFWGVALHSSTHPALALRSSSFWEFGHVSAGTVSEPAISFLNTPIEVHRLWRPLLCLDWESFRVFVCVRSNLYKKQILSWRGFPTYGEYNVLSILFELSLP